MFNVLHYVEQCTLGLLHGTLSSGEKLSILIQEKRAYAFINLYNHLIYQLELEKETRLRNDVENKITTFLLSEPALQSFTFTLHVQVFRSATKA